MTGPELRTCRRLHLVSLGLFVALGAGVASAGEFERSFTFDSEELLVASLIGEIQVEQSNADVFDIEVRVRGEDADESLLDFETHEGRSAELLIRFPIDEERQYVYPRMGRRGSASFSPPGARGDDGLGGLWGMLSGKHRSIKVRGRGQGLELWADVTVRVPRGKSLVVVNGAGDLVAEDLEASLVLDVSTGQVSARRIAGDLVADTGSGSVIAEEVTGELTVDTGSGSVAVAGCQGSSVSVDTGSGSVYVDRVDCRRLTVDTGSGGVEARDIGADHVTIDTGSGSVELELTRMGSGRFKVDTGSGSIDLRVPPDASARVSADTSSGTITTDLEGRRVRRSRDEVRLTLGDGDADVTLDTGSGSIRIRS